MNRHPHSLLAAVTLAAVLAGCGGSPTTHQPSASTQPATAVPATTATSATTAPPVPKSLTTAEGAAEDLIDLAVAGDRAGVVAKARVLASAATGPARADATAGGVPAATVEEFARRAEAVMKLAPDAPLLDVALASNHAFALIPDLFRPFATDVPVEVIALDQLDFEAKIRAEQRDLAPIKTMLEQLRSTWGTVRPDLIARNAEAVANRFDAHIAALDAAAAAGDAAATAAEAQNGLQLVDDVEAAFKS